MLKSLKSRKQIGIGFKLFAVLLIAFFAGLSSVGQLASSAAGDVVLNGSSFADTDAEDTHQASQWVVRDSGAIVFDSGSDAANLTSITIPAATFTLGTTYYWKVRYQDQHLVWSDYSAEGSFTYGSVPVVSPSASASASVSASASPSASATESPTATATCALGYRDIDGDGEEDDCGDSITYSIVYAPDDKSDFCAGSTTSFTFYYSSDDFVRSGTAWQDSLEEKVYDVYLSIDGGSEFSRIAQSLSLELGASFVSSLPSPLKSYAQGFNTTVFSENNIQNYLKVTSEVAIPSNMLSDPSRAKLLVNVMDRTSYKNDLGDSFVLDQSKTWLENAYRENSFQNYKLIDYTNAVQSKSCSVAIDASPTVVVPPPSQKCSYKINAPKLGDRLPINRITRIIWSKIDSVSSKMKQQFDNYLFADESSGNSPRVLGTSVGGPFNISAYPVQGEHRMIFSAKPDFNVSRYYMWWNCQASAGEENKYDDLVKKCGEPSNTAIGAQVKVQGRQAAFIKSFGEPTSGTLTVFALPKGSRIGDKGKTSTLEYTTVNRSLVPLNDYQFALSANLSSGELRTVAEDLDVPDGNVSRQTFSYWHNCNQDVMALSSLDQVKAVCGNPQTTSSRYDVRYINLAPADNISRRVVAVVTSQSGQTEFIGYKDLNIPVSSTPTATVTAGLSLTATTTSTPSTEQTPAILWNPQENATVYFSPDGGRNYSLLKDKLQVNYLDFFFTSSHLTKDGKIRLDNYDDSGKLYSTCYSDRFSIESDLTSGEGTACSGFLCRSKKALNFALVLGSLLSTLASLLLGAITSIPVLNRLLQLLSPLFALPVWPGKKPAWGIVYDAVSKKPIAGAIIRVFSEPDGRLRSSIRTNEKGSFGFLLLPGKYSAVVSMLGYEFPTHLVLASSDGKYHNIYRGGEFTVEGDGNEKAQVNINIPLDRTKLSALDILQVNFLAIITKFFKTIRVPLLILGSISVIYLVFTEGRAFDYVVAVIYVLLWAIEIRNLLKKKSYGVVKDHYGRPIDLVLIRATDVRGVIKETVITGKDGKFQLNLEPGQYRLDLSRSGYKSIKTQNFMIKKIQDLGKISLRLDKL